MAGVSSKQLSVQHFQSKEQDGLSSLSKIIEMSFAQKVKRKLVALGYDEDELDEVSQEVLYEGVEIYENCDIQSDDIRELNALEELHSGLSERAVLVVRFPTETTELQDETFAELYPTIRSKPKDNPTDRIQAPTYADAISAIQDFIKDRARQSRKVVVVFQGERSPKGLWLKGEPNPIGIDRLFKDSQKILEQVTTARPSAMVQLPQAMDIVVEKQGEIEVLFESMSGEQELIVVQTGPSVVMEAELDQMVEDIPGRLQLDDDKMPQCTMVSNVTCEIAMDT